ncbi:uncharacterized protein [Blastocystis hominis]|uniref:GST C-terminal domain-containing protein n=1 Tax=Blastocystis hominis TaxID=12968 RepID=D8M3P4_BLAHO|nr:uncharacterized protein [Blastocystis hominis]CBK22517.2 unnamed protein product [Blastocystis hominis]|eukprot:XP_012896565.1 uncharacterized protein [Blastocystis hominis]
MLTLLKNSNRTERILVTLKALGSTDLQITEVDAEPEFIYQRGDVKLNDSNEVLKALCAESPLYGTLPAEMKEQADEWLKFCYEQLETPATVLTWLQNGTLTRDQVPPLAEKKARSDIMMLLRKIEVRLKESPFLAGNDLSIADIAVGTCLRPLFVHVLGEVERKNNQSMCVWIEKLYKSAAFMEVFGETTLLVSAKKGKKK